MTSHASPSNGSQTEAGIGGDNLGAQIKAVPSGSLLERVACLRKANQLAFTNRTAAAEALLAEGIQSPPPNTSGATDLRGAFGVLDALVAGSSGLGSLDYAHFTDCLGKFRTAAKLAKHDKDWIGRKAVKGLCYLAIGLIELVEHMFIKGVYNIMRAWKYIKVLRAEGISYTGEDAGVVRSASLFAVAAFYVVYSFLPPTTSKVATYLSGFHCKRRKGLELLKQCWKEDGIYAPWAAWCWLLFHTDTATFIGERLSDEDRLTCIQVLEWAEARFPKSMLFSVSKADFAALQRNPAEATRTIVDNTNSFNLPESNWVLHYKLGVYSWCMLKWAEGAAEFEKAMQVTVSQSKRAMVPYMAAFAMLGYLQAYKQSSANITLLDKAKEMAEVLRKYKKMHKRHWGKQDSHAFRLFKHYDNVEESKAWVLVQVVELMSLHLRSSWCMHANDLDKLESLLKAECQERQAAYTLTADDKADFFLCMAEIKLRRGNVDKALDMAAQGIDIEEELSREAKRKGTVQMMLYMMAQMYGEKGDLDRAKACMKELKAHGTHYHLHALVHLKGIVLAKKIGDEFIQDYKQFKIPARMEETVVMNVSTRARFPIEWSWYVEKYTIRFRAEFTPASGAPIVVIQEVSQNDTESKHLIGEFHPQEPGKLSLVWSNDFSIFRSKLVFYKIAGPVLISSCSCDSIRAR